MDNERWNHVDQLLQSALDIPAAERDAYLRNVCGGDQRLEHEVRSLVAAHDRADRFLGAPAIALAARELAGALEHREPEQPVAVVQLHRAVRLRIDAGQLEPLSDPLRRAEN